MSNVEEILSKYVDKKSMDELSENVWPDIVDAMKECTLQVVREAVDEEKEAWSFASDDALFALDDLLNCIEGKLTEDE